MNDAADDSDEAGGEEGGEGGDESGDEGEGSVEGGDEDSDVDGAGGGSGTEEDKTLAPRSSAPTRPTGLCTTRVAARRSLFFSMARLHKGLKLYAHDKKCAWEMDEAEWQAVTEFLAIFDGAHNVTTLVQTEQLMVSNLRSDTLTVVELGKVT